MFEDREKANEVAAAVHKQLDGDEERKNDTTHVEVHEAKHSV